MLPDLRSLELYEHIELAREAGLGDYRGSQVFRWVHGKGVINWDAMSDLPLTARQELARKARISRLEIMSSEISSRNDTRKLLFKLEDGATLETVLMFYRQPRKRTTVCVSSQVGCAMGCSFCATGASGFERNLTSGEIVGQVLEVSRDPGLTGEGGVSNVVFMGMGEPLANYHEVVKAVRLLHHPSGQGISLRRITVSTCGLIPQIKRLSDEGLPVELTVSLHAADNALRNTLVPVNRKYPVEKLMDACRTYSKKTGRRVTYAYALIKGVNDGKDQAEALASLLAGSLCYVNIIPWNSVPGMNYKGASPEGLIKFAAVLRRLGVNVVVRATRGAEINAACGQLRRRGGSRALS